MQGGRRLRENNQVAGIRDSLQGGSHGSSSPQEERLALRRILYEWDDKADSRDGLLEGVECTSLVWRYLKMNVIIASDIKIL